MKIRTTKEMRNKIFKLEERFNEACGRAASETGAGIKERDRVSTFSDLAPKRLSVILS